MLPNLIGHQLRSTAEVFRNLIPVPSGFGDVFRGGEIDFAHLAIFHDPKGSASTPPGDEADGVALVALFQEE